MAHPRHAEPIYAFDHDGAPIALMPLASGETAKLDAADMRAWTAAGHSPHWTLNSSGNGYAYVRASNPQASGGLISVARAIMSAGSGKIVKYHDGDTLNLRSGNLYVTSGRAKRCDATIPATPRRPSAAPLAAE